MCGEDCSWWESNGRAVSLAWAKPVVFALPAVFGVNLEVVVGRPTTWRMARKPALAASHALIEPDKRQPKLTPVNRRNLTTH